MEQALNALCPRISVYATEDVDTLLATHCGLPDLATLLKPWQTAGVERVQIRSSTFETSIASTFPLRFDLATDVTEEGSFEREGGWLDAVAKQIHARLDDWLDDLPMDAHIPQTPWYDLFLRDLLEMRPMHPHDTFSHPVACLLAVSTAHAEPLNALAALYAATSPTELFKDRPYADPTVLRYYVVVHDVRNGDLAESQALLEQIKRAYGVHCAILPINSLDLNAPPPLEGVKDERPPYFDGLWLPFMSKKPSFAGSNSASPLPPANKPLPRTEAVSTIEAGSGLGHKDVLAIRVFLREFVVQSLLPSMERNIAQWNEQLTATRRGLTNRFFSAGRKYFGSRPASPAVGGPPAFIPAKGYYPHQAQEAQARKLADFAFMTRDYKLAISTYDLVRKDNQNDKAWQDCASATRLMGLSHLMQALQGSPNSPRSPLKIDADVYLEQAQMSSAGLLSASVDELKLTSLYAAAYGALDEPKMAAESLARCAADIEEISSALLLEQAAVWYLADVPPSRRKGALHLCLAALRYEKSGIKALSQRCLHQAEAVYGSDAKGWLFIRDHVQHSLGRQSYGIGRSDAAIEHFLRLLAHTPEGEEVDQSGFLGDFELAMQHLGDEASQVVERRSLRFPQAFFNAERAHFRFARGRESSSSVPLAIWERLERNLLTDLPAGETEVALHKASGHVAAINETLHLVCAVQNPLAAKIILSDVALNLDSDSAGSILQVEKLQSVELGPLETVTVSFAITASEEVNVHVKGVQFTVNGQLKSSDSLQRRGKRLQKTREHRLEPTYAEDTSLVVSIQASTPMLDVDVTDLPSDLLHGEMRPLRLRLVNSGKVALRNIRFACSDRATVFVNDSASVDGSILEVSNALSASTVTNVPLAGGNLEPGSSHVLNLYTRGDQVGQQQLALLFAFASAETADQRLYVARTSFTLDVRPLLHIQTIVRPCQSGTAPYRVELHLRNELSDASVRLDRVTSLSPLWFMQQVSSEAMMLHAGETQTLALNVDRKNTSSDTDIDFTARQLEAYLGGKKALESETPAVALQVGELLPSDSVKLPLASILASRRRDRTQQLSQTFEALPEELLSCLFELFSPRSLDIVLSYNLVDSHKRSGFSLIPDIRLGPAEGTPLMAEVLDKAESVAGGIYAEAQRERGLLITAFRRSEYMGDAMPISVSCEGPQAIEVAFSSQTLSKKVPLTLRLRNLALQRVVDFVLDLDPVSLSEESSARASYIGKLVHRGTLQPNEQVEIACQVWLPSVGVYDVSAWHLLVKDVATGQVWETTGTKRLIYVRQKEVEAGR